MSQEYADHLRSYTPEQAAAIGRVFGEPDVVADWARQADEQARMEDPANAWEIDGDAASWSASYDAAEAEMSAYYDTVSSPSAGDCAEI